MAVAKQADLQNLAYDTTQRHIWIMQRTLSVGEYEPRQQHRLELSIQREPANKGKQ